MTVGAALALKGSGRVPIGLHGRRRFPDGQHGPLDRRPLRDPVPHGRLQQPLVLQRRAAPGARGDDARPPLENRWIGQRIAEPDIDLAAMARAQGAPASARSTDPAEVQPAIEKGIAAARAGGVCVIDAQRAAGYDSRG